MDMIGRSADKSGIDLIPI